MIPLERYLTSLMPLAKNISPYRAAPKVKPFIIEDFLRSLESGGPQLTPMVKGDWEALYKRFFKSPNFVGWFNQRHREVSQKLQVYQNIMWKNKDLVGCSLVLTPSRIMY